MINWSPLLLVLVYFTYLTYATSHHIRHHRDRFKRHQGEHLYLPGSYVTDGEGDDEPDAGLWLDWSSPSQCSRTCGGGVSTQYRRCTPGYHCRGPTRRHFSCNTQDCPDLADFRAIQCAEFNTIPFEGTLYEWVPYTKSPQPCELNCMPRGERFYYRHKLRVVDGTRCSDESLDVCVEGKCQPVGCDMMLGSDAKEDQCRVCEGDGSTCNTMNGLLDMQDLQVGYNDILLIPAGAVNIKVREVDRSNNYLAIRNVTGHYYLNGNWRIDFPRTLDIAGSKFHYERSPQGFSAPDTITSIGPIEESLFIVLLYQDRNVGIHYEYSIPKSRGHIDTETYAWTFDQFTPCSASCGGGSQSRNVSCAGRKSLEPVDVNLCDANNKPVEVQKCGEIPCEPKWVAKEWEKCSVPCGKGGTQTRKIYCEQVISSGVPSIVDDEQCANLQKPPTQQECNRGLICGEWHVGPWKPCNRLCGKGKETREVTCYRKVDGKITILEDSECSRDEKPDTSRSCSLRPCEGVDWVVSEWSGCDNKCGLSEETRAVQCMTASGEIHPDKLCAEDEEKPETTRKCTTKTEGCDYEWYASQWSECSAKCGSGVQTRKVFCTKATDDGFKKVEDAKCDPAKKYSPAQNCTAEETECPGEWFTGPWTKCSKNCGGGLKTRKVLCIKGNSTAHVKECDPDLTPSSSEECNKQACDKDEASPLVTAERVVITTEGPSVTEDDEYEIVEDDECEDGEWVDAHGIPQRKLGPHEKLQSAVSKSLGESTDTDAKKQPENPLAEDELMLRDDTYIGDLHSGQVAQLTAEPGSGEEDLQAGTDNPVLYSLSEGSGDIYLSTFDGSGDYTDTTETTETTFMQSSFYSLGSSFSVDFTTESPDVTELSTTVDLETKETETTDEDTEATEVASESDITAATTEGLASEATDDDESDLSSASPVSGESSVELTTTTTPTEETTAPVTAETKPDVSTDVAATDSTDVTSEKPEITSDVSQITEEMPDATTESVTDITDDVGKLSVTTEEAPTGATDVSTVSVTTEEAQTGATDITKVSVTTEEAPTGATDVTTQPSEEASTKVTDATSVTDITDITSEKAATEVTEAITKDAVTDATEDISKEPATEITTVSREPGVSLEATTIGVTDITLDALTGVTTEELDITEEGSTPEVSISLTAFTEAVTEEDIGVSVTTEEEARSGGPSVGTTDKLEISTQEVTKATGAEETTTEEIQSTTEAISKATEGVTERTTTSGITERGTEGATEEATKEVTEEATEETEKSEATTEGIISTTVASVVSRVASIFTRFTDITEEFTTASGVTDEITTEEEEEEGTTESESVTHVTKVTETTEGITEGTTEYDIWSSTEGPTETSSLVEIFTTPKARWCKRPRRPTCKKSEFGCCSDKITPAKGPFDKGCPMPKTCQETKYGCCQDGVSPATGKGFRGCPESQCDRTLFGCCPDNTTPSQGNNNEGCPPPPPECAKSKFGCCEDNATEAKGPNKEGCKETLEGLKEDYTTEDDGIDISSTTIAYATTEGEDCTNTVYGCCPDGVSIAEGEFFKGCDIIDPTDCNKSYYKCCPDGITSAQGPNNQGCKIECLKNAFGCCDDGVTPAHGYNKEGCCLNTQHGCCPDNITPAQGPKQEGCGCSTSTFGCCPDNVTPAQGSNKEGCGCQYTQYGCCPDNHAQATGPDYGGCPCHTFQFGCCPDGVTAATGVRNEGCGCAHTEHGCCSDGKTPAAGPNFAGCDCLSSKYGCCPDGETEAQGEDFDGCTDVPENLQASCHLTKDRGGCRNYTVKWFYDMEYGGCSRFWYGGCDGNGNRFKSKEECHNICVEPTGKDRCKLPKVAGPCEGYYPQWYYDNTRNLCTQFIYGGCLGNNNRFETQEECNDLCVTDVVSDPCQQPQESGPCHGSFINWFYNKETGFCEQFIYGGCRGNDNNFNTEAACKHKCAPASKKKLKETCQLPADSGECSNYVSRYYYDTKDKACKHFYYGGCGGNKNNFISEGACLTRCQEGHAETEPPPPPPVTAVAVTEKLDTFKTEYCYLPPEAGPCRNAEARWFYNNDGTCRQFAYGGCGGNENNFRTSEECYQRCQDAADVCSLPMTPGPCDADYVAWYYNQTTQTCQMFKYGGCMGNGNKFDDFESCERRCKKAPATEAPQYAYTTSGPDDPRRVCFQTAETGNCNDTIHSFYYDPSLQKCKVFLYSGCGGNDNRFANIESCERYCGVYRGVDACSFPHDTGPCRAYFPMYYYDVNSGSCKEFIYGGCDGNANRFSTIDECNQLCGSRQPVEQPLKTTAAPATAAPPPQPESPHPEPEESETCRQYQEECSTLRCQYGMKGYVENLCNRCKCVDPCEDVICSEGTRCEVELNRNQNDVTDASTFVGVCKEINKLGDCPYVRGSGEECREDCKDDADCVMDLKCCSNGCGHVCLMPSITTLAPPAELRTTVGYLPVYTQRTLPRDKYAPEVIEEEFNPIVTAGEGDYATLKCAIRGNPKPVFSWSKDDVLIDGSEPRYRILLEGAALQIISLYKTDAGIYLCSADNNIGKPLKKEIRLEVIVPVRANITLTSTNYPVGSDVNIPCDVEGYPIPTVQWYKDGKPLLSSHTIQITESHRLIIKNTTESDSGEYRCAAWNQYSNATSTVPLLIQGRFIHPSCKDNPFFANCPLIIKANFCSHKYYARFCCRSCTEAGMLPSVGPHLGPDSVQNDLA